MKQKKFSLGILGLLLVFVFGFGLVVFACAPSSDSPAAPSGGHREDVEESADGDAAWAAAWAGYSKDNLPPPSYWNNKGEEWNWPDVFTMIDGTKVTTKAQWAQRYEEIKEILQYYLYGYLPPTPTVVASTTWDGTANVIPIKIDMTNPANGNTATANVNITLPTDRTIYPDGAPVSFGGNASHQARGFATTGQNGLDAQVTALFQYAANDPDHGSDLMNDAWGEGRIIDAIEQLATNPGDPLYHVLATDKFTVTGHSRGGKAAIVAAAFEPRITVASPSSSGALGLAPERFIRTAVLPTNGVGTHGGNPEGKGWWYMDAARGANDVPKNHVMSYLVPGVPPPGFVRAYGPIQSIQGYDHARTDSGGDFANGRKGTWVSNRFMQFSRFRVDQFWTSENGYEGKGSMAQVPFDQHFLTALMAGPDPDHPRAIIMSAGNEGDSWVHPEGTYINYLITLELYKFLETLGVTDATKLLIPIMDNTGGHVHTAIRHTRQLDMCDYLWKGTPLPPDIIDVSAEPGYELYGFGAEYPLDIRSLDDYHRINIKNPADPNAKSLSEIADEYFATHNHY